MQTFRYEATDPSGVAITATIEAATEEHAMGLLRARGLVVRGIAPQLATASAGLHWQRPASVAQARHEVTCGWCRVQFVERPASEECSNCGGALPLSSADERGDAPPPLPRKLPGSFAKQLYFRRNEEGMMGLVLVLIGSTIVVFGGGSLGAVLGGGALGFVGLVMAFRGFRGARRRRRALVHGATCPGRVQDVTQDARGSSWGNDVAYRVRYQFGAGGTWHAGELTTTNASVRAHYPGELVWVVCVPNEMENSAIWPFLV